MRDADADDELPPVIGERYLDVMAERAIALLDDYAPEPPVRPCGRVLGSEHPTPLEAAGGDCGKN